MLANMAFVSEKDKINMSKVAIDMKGLAYIENVVRSPSTIH